MDTIDKPKKKEKAQRIDRSEGKYSEADYRALPRSEQLDLAELYQCGHVSDFDKSKIFQFSYSHFSDICKQIGFKKGVVDTLENDKSEESTDPKTESIIQIDHGRREKTAVKKLTLSVDTISMMDELMGDGLSNIERSKVIDIILSKTLKQLLADKESGCFHVSYRPLNAKLLV